MPYWQDYRSQDALSLNSASWTFKKKLKTFMFYKHLSDWLSFLHFYLYVADRLFAVGYYCLLLLLLLLLSDVWSMRRRYLSDLEWLWKVFIIIIIIITSLSSCDNCETAVGPAAQIHATSWMTVAVVNWWRCCQSNCLTCTTLPVRRDVYCWPCAHLVVNIRDVEVSYEWLLYVYLRRTRCC